MQPRVMGSLYRQIARFASVGVASTLLHAGLAIAFRDLGQLSAPLSNFCGYAIALVFNFTASWLWTFSRVGNVFSALPRFLAMNALGFGLSQAIVYVCAVVEGWPMWLAMVPVVATVPVMSFFISRTYVFRPATST